MLCEYLRKYGSSSVASDLLILKDSFHIREEHSSAIKHSMLIHETTGWQSWARCFQSKKHLTLFASFLKYIHNKIKKITDWFLLHCHVRTCTNYTFWAIFIFTLESSVFRSVLLPLQIHRAYEFERRLIILLSVLNVHMFNTCYFPFWPYPSIRYPEIGTIEFALFDYKPIERSPHKIRYNDTTVRDCDYKTWLL